MNLFFQLNIYLDLMKKKEGWDLFHVSFTHEWKKSSLCLFLASGEFISLWLTRIVNVPER
jgi:hypothetical protein